MLQCGIQTRLCCTYFFKGEEEARLLKHGKEVTSSVASSAEATSPAEKAANEKAASEDAALEKAVSGSKLVCELFT